MLRRCADKLTDNGFQLVYVGVPMKILQCLQGIRHQTDDFLTEFHVIFVDQLIRKGCYFLGLLIQILDIQMCSNQIVTQSE